MQRQNSRLFLHNDEDILTEELDPEESFILGFLKESNRKEMKILSEEGFFDVEYY